MQIAFRFLKGHVCSIYEEDAMLRCLDYGLTKLFCPRCDQDVHLFKPLHDREVWEDGFLNLFLLPLFTQIII